MTGSTYKLLRATPRFRAENNDGLWQWRIYQGAMGRRIPLLAAKEFFFVKLKLIKILSMKCITHKIKMQEKPYRPTVAARALPRTPLEERTGIPRLPANWDGARCLSSPRRNPTPISDFQVSSFGVALHSMQFLDPSMLLFLWTLKISWCYYCRTHFSFFSTFFLDLLQYRPFTVVSLCSESRCHP